MDCVHDWRLVRWTGATPNAPEHMVWYCTKCRTIEPAPFPLKELRGE